MIDGAAPGCRCRANGESEFARLDAGTRAYYDANAVEYAGETYQFEPRGLWQLIESHLPTGSRLLDLGCGAGRDLSHFVKAGYVPVGLERSEVLARVAREYSGCAVVVADFRALPFRRAVFHGVYAVASLLHSAPEHLTRVMSAAREALVAGGIFVASVKEGQGTRIDQRGRYTAYYEGPCLLATAERAGFSAVRVVRNEERRGSEMVRWLTVVGFSD